MAGDWILVPHFGMKGAAIASSIGYSFSGMYSLIVFSKQSGWSFKDLLLVKEDDIQMVKNIFHEKLIVNG